MKFALAIGLLSLLSSIALADGVSSAQKRAATDVLAAGASGGAEALGGALHPAELETLRQKLLVMLRDDAAKGDTGVRARLFGDAMILSEIERWTPQSFYANLARRLEWRVRNFDDVKWLGVVKDNGDAVIVVARGVLPKEQGSVSVPLLVSLIPYGKDWKGSMPGELQAQIDDLIGNRTDAGNAGRSRAALSALPAANNRKSLNHPADMLAFLKTAQKLLIDDNCDEYYKEAMSPSFRKTIANKAFETLINACHNSIGTREMLISSLRILEKLPPRLEYDGTRASFDVSGQGLPFDQFVLEKIDKRWYVAE